MKYDFTFKMGTYVTYLYGGLQVDSCVIVFVGGSTYLDRYLPTYLQLKYEIRPLNLAVCTERYTGTCIGN